MCGHCEHGDHKECKGYWIDLRGREKKCHCTCLDDD